MRPTTVLVEGESDRLAVEALVRREGRDPLRTGTTVVAMGGATSIGHFLVRFGPAGADHRLLALCDAAEAAYVSRSLRRASADAQVQVCDADLEDELVRCLGTDAVLEAVDREGELASFRLLQRQPALRERSLPAQLHRFFGGRSGHKIRYATLLVEALPPGVAPPPLTALVAAL